MASVPPYNTYQQVPGAAGQPNQAPPPPQGQYSQSPHLQHQYSSPPPHQYVPGQQPNYQSPPPGHAQQVYQTSQPPPAQYAQSPQGYPQQYTPGQQPNYQSPPSGQHVNQHPQSPQVHHPQSSQGQYPPQQPIPGQQTSYQAPTYGVAAPPTPAQHQQHYQQQAAQFAVRPSAQAQLQSTAQSLFKSGKGILGNLASNIKSKYPASSSAPNASTTSATSYTGEAPKPTYNPAQHPTQTPLSPTNSFPQGYGQPPPQSQPHQPYGHQASPTSQHSVPPVAPSYPPTQHQAAHAASPAQQQNALGQPPHLSWEARLEAAQHPYPQLQQSHATGIPGVPGAVPQAPIQSPPGSSPYPQPVLHHQHSNPHEPTPLPSGHQPPAQAATYAGSPGQAQSPPQVLSPHQQLQSAPPHLQPQASWPQQGNLSGPYNSTLSSPPPPPQTAPQLANQGVMPGHGPSGVPQQPQYHQQASAINPHGQTSSQQAFQPSPQQAVPVGVAQSPNQVPSPQQPHQSAPPQGYLQNEAPAPYNPVTVSGVSSTVHPVPGTTAQIPPASHPQSPPAMQSPHQHHQSPPLQQPTSTPPVAHNQQSPHPGAPTPHGNPYHPDQAQVTQTGSAPGVVQPVPPPSQAHYYPPPPPLQQPEASVNSVTVPAPGQFQAYNPSASQQPPQSQYAQPPELAATSSTASQHYTSPPPPHSQGGVVSHGQAPASSPPATADQRFQLYQPSSEPPNPQLSQANGSNALGQPDAHGYQQDPVASLSAQMSNLNVLNSGHPPTASVPSPSTRQDGPRGPPPCQATGMSSDIVPYCPEHRIVSYSLDWYRFTAVPQYLICTRCYTDHVQKTHLAGHFERYHSPEGTESKCGFWSPRAREVLWPQALQTNDVGPLRTWMEKSLTLKPCKGRVWTTAADGIKWWGMANNEIDGFIACDACYEDCIGGTAFESHFQPYRQQGQDEKWMCDMCIPYIAKTAVKMAKQNHWNGFVGAAKVRIQLPLCEGRDEESNSGHWMVPRRKIKDLTICEACYLDKLALTPFGNEFERHQRAEGFDAFLESLGQKWKCKLTNTAVNMSVALETAIYRRDFEVFWNAANAICGLVPCTSHGIVRGNWWTVAGGCADFDVCEACYKGIVETLGLEKFFEPAQRDQTIDIICNFCPGTPRWGMFITKFAEALDKGVFSHYSDYVKKWAGVPTCPGIKDRGKGTWWGHPEALACQDCWLNFMADTPLGDSVPVKGVYDERTLICQLWSPRMRNMWLAACAAGPPGSPESQKALDEFKAFGARRVQVYNETVPHIEMIQQMRMMKQMQALQQGQLSLMYQGMNSMAVLSDTTDGYWHGNSSVGYYETEHGVTAANMMNNMHAGMADANKMSDWQRIAQLQAIWMEVE
ncbi:integral membrane protein [Fusarium beomiforme]|uniref:Integral membrane protein n=1 Tax=Fusarium beomiforme TaxID=44412 RepID=A0A9P5ANI1_9HYPO|nr:integral membrane protein [Fusarium beomiforme]